MRSLKVIGDHAVVHAYNCHKRIFDHFYAREHML